MHIFSKIVKTKNILSEKNKSRKGLQSCFGKEWKKELLVLAGEIFRPSFHKKEQGCGKQNCWHILLHLSANFQQGAFLYNLDADKIAFDFSACIMTCRLVLCGLNFVIFSIWVQRLPYRTRA